MINIDKYKPAVSKHILLLLAGVIWACVGVMLMALAVTWLSKVPLSSAYLFGGAGVAFALVIHHFGFLKIVNKNLGRILPANEKKCLFGFFPWKSYLLIPIMVTMGILLRHSSLPKQYLAVLYTAIGLALVLSSVRYLRIFFQTGDPRS